MTPEAIMIFAAGFGTRMEALTHARPKPLIEVAGQALLDRALAMADDAKIARKVVNTHYLGDMIARHLANRDDVAVSHEVEKALETGGGLKQALAVLQSDPVFTLNPDAVWTGENPLSGLAENWQADRMEALLMLVPQAASQNHAGKGDFVMDQDGRLTRCRDALSAALIYSGAQIINTAPVALIPAARFSLNLVWDQMIARGRLFGVVHTGGWVDVGSPLGIKVAETMLKAAQDV